VTKRILMGAALAAICGSSAAAAPTRVQPMTTWVISPDAAACRADLELTGHTGATVLVAMTSDGDRVVMRFTKEDIPERAFLPIRIDQKPYSNLMQRTADPKVGELVLSEETLGAMRRGKTLQVAWLTDEIVGGPLAGSELGIADLRTCGLQAASQSRTRLAAEQATRARAQAEAHAKALADAQLQAARAQAAAAEAARQRADNEAEQQRATQAAEQRANLEAQRRQAYENAQRRQVYDDDETVYQPAPQFWPPRPVYSYRRPY
jgi:hypothetical protein